MQYEKMVVVGNNIACKIGELGLGEVPDKPVVFCGACRNPETCTTFKGELVGCSFWEELNPIRKNYVMNIIGYPYIYPSQEQIEYATNEAKNLPSYPSEGCVKDLGEVIVVKLSD